MYNPGLEGMPLDKRRKYYDERVRWIVNYAYENAPFIRRKLDEAGVDPSEIHSVKDLQKIPITHKEELIELQKANPPFAGMLAVPPNKVFKYFRSIGPIFGVSGTSEAFWEMEKKVFYSLGFREGDIVLITFSYHLVSAAWDADEALRRLGAVVVAGGVGNTEEQVEVAHKLKITGYVGTPSFLIALIKRAEKMGYDFRRDFRLKVAAVGGEPLQESLREELEITYGLSVFNIFGTADTHWIGYECEKKHGMHIVEEVLLEIVDPITNKQLQAGETGEMVVTCFDETYPLIRLSLGDLVSISNEICPCGRTSSRLVKFAGRARDVIRVRGRFVYPHVLRKVFECVSEVSKYQLVASRQEQRDEMTLLIEFKEVCNNKDMVIDNIKSRFKKACILKIDDVKMVQTGTIEGEQIIVDKRTWS